MTHLDDREANERHAAQLVDRSVVGAKVTGDETSASGLWLDLDDGSRVIIDGLSNGGLEVTWQSPDDVFDFDREVMEEELGDPPDFPPAT